jgi:DNA recombination protein RmuC
MESLIPVLMIFIGAVVGAVAVWLILRAQSQRSYEDGKADSATEIATLHERLAAKDAELQALHDGFEKEVAERRGLLAELREETEQRSAAEQKASRISSLEAELAVLHEQNAVLRSSMSSLEATLESQEKTALEKLELIVNAREELSTQFKSLANDILDEKGRKFAEQNKSNLDTLLNPLAQKILAFEKRVEETYDKESKQRFSLETEIGKLRDLNTRISQDAINLTNALKGQTKTQGAWGEIILERVLEMSGLVRGREYEVQVMLTSEEGKRSCPDVIVYLPEQRHLVIDSKVNLVAYERYCTLSDGPEREAELKKNITAFRKHVAELDLKHYQDHYKLNSLDFVLMFVPIEGAFMIAVQNDDKLFNQAFEKNLVIVSPSTLLATMRTISNLWRQEDQNRNALKIAKQAGRLYDKFVAFFKDLQDIGVKLQAAQTSYDNAHNKLISGRGNIVNRIDNLRVLGARAEKKLPQDVVDDAMEDEDVESGTLSPVGVGSESSLVVNDLVTQVELIEPNIESPQPLVKSGRGLSLDGGGLFPELVSEEDQAAEQDSTSPLDSKRAAGQG